MYTKEWWQKVKQDDLTREKRYKQFRDWAKKNPERSRARRSEWAQANRLKCIEHYTGGKNACMCCGEKTLRFLTIDHIKNDGWLHGRLIKGDLTRWLVKNDFPAGIQILCYNCNFGRAQNQGTCPHHAAIVY